MIDEKEINERIAEIQYSRDQSPDECIYLASLYTIRDHLFGEKDNNHVQNYSTVSAPAVISSPSFAVTVSGDSDFLRAVSGKDKDAAWDIIDDLMDTLKVAYPRVYESVMRKIGNL